jgi:hypothetical protein
LWKILYATATTVEPVPRRTNPNVRCIGSVRLPIAGPYRPVARLYRFPDGRLLWHVRLWEHDRAVPHLVPTRVLRTFAQVNGLPSLDREIRHLVREARRADA